jgi:replicative DNA helicase
VAKRGQRVGLVTLEMTRTEVAIRLLAMELRVPTTQVETLIQAGDDAAIDAPGRLSDLPLFIEDTGSIGVSELRTKCKRLHAQHTLDLLIVDYIGLIAPPEEQVNETQALSRISRALKVLANDLQLPLLCLSQLNREVEKRVSKVPQLGELRQSGALEQDANVVLFIYRDELYDAESVEQGQARVIAAKQRNGPTGTCALRFAAACTRFDTLARYARVAGW